MNLIDAQGVGVIPITALSAAGTSAIASFDTKGYRSCNIYLQAYSTSAAASGFVSSISVKESDTVTSPTSQTAIVAYTGGTATSTSVGFVLGGDTANSGAIGACDLQIDLKGRKRYLGLYIVADQGETSYAGGFAVFSRGEQSADDATGSHVENLAATVANLSNVVSK